MLFTTRQMEMMKVLEIQPPFTQRQLRKKFTDACFKYHPDTGGETKSTEMFIKSKEAFDSLYRFCEVEKTSISWRDLLDLCTNYNISDFRINDSCIKFIFDTVDDEDINDIIKSYFNREDKI